MAPAATRGPSPVGASAPVAPAAVPQPRPPAARGRARRCAGPRCDRPCAARRLHAVWRADRRASYAGRRARVARVRGQPSWPGGGSQRERGAEASVNERLRETPLLAVLPSDRPRGALPMPVRSPPRRPSSRADHEVVGVELERGQSRADRDVEGAAGERERVARNREGTPASIGLTRVLSPAARWLMREMSLLGRKRLKSSSRRSTRSKPACAACAAYAHWGTRRALRRRWPSPRAAEAPYIAQCIVRSIPSPPPSVDPGGTAGSLRRGERSSAPPESSGPCSTVAVG